MGNCHPRSRNLPPALHGDVETACDELLTNSANDAVTAEFGRACAAMKVAFDMETSQMSNTDEKNLFLFKCLSKMQDNILRSCVISSKARDRSCALVTLGRNTSTATTPARTSHDGPRVNPKYALPPEVLRHAIGLLDRTSLNNLALTSKYVNEVIGKDKPWPGGGRCPFTGGTPDGILFSPDWSRVVMYTDEHLDEDSYDSGELEVWDKSAGLLQELGWESELGEMKPVFSPDSRLFVVGSDPHMMGDMTGISIFDLSEGTSSDHELSSVTSAAFLDNHTLALTTKHAHGVKVYGYSRNSNRGRLVYLETIFADLNHPPNPVRRYCSKIASFSGTKQSVIAYAYHSSTRSVTLHDRKRNISISRPIPDSCSRVLDLAFSQNGVLAVAHGKGGLSLLDCNVDSFEDIGQPSPIKLDESRYSYNHISFSPDGSKIITNYANSTRIRVIDVRCGTTLSDGWTAATWELLAGLANGKPRTNAT